MYLFGPLEWFWLVAPSILALAIGWSLGGEEEGTFISVDEGYSQIAAHCLMVAAIALNTKLVVQVWNFLVAALPQPGTDINQITTVAIMAVSAVGWVVLPVCAAMLREVVRDYRRSNDGCL